MSLRRRFVVLAMLATFAVGAAALTIVQLFARSDSVREEGGQEAADAMVSALDRALGPPSQNLVAPNADALRRIAEGVAAPQVDAHAGFCTPFIAAASPGPHREPRHAELPPDQRDFVRDACRAAAIGQVLHQRLAHPHDVIVVSTRGVATDLAAWALVRVPTHPEEGPLLPLGLGVMALATVALAALTVEAMVALRRGGGDLELALFRLRDDLRSELPTPRPEELARIVDGLRSLGQRLADSHDRELSLERALGHEQRLAGLGRVTAGVAHEIRNPLAAIKLKLDGLVRRALDPRTDADLRVCLQEVGRLDEIIGAMLLVARKAPTDPERLSLGELADERTTLLQEQAGRKQVSIVRSGDVVAMVNRMTVTRTMDNLLRNAIEASPPGGHVRIALTTRDGKATIDVVDDGPGVTPGRAAELFEPFFTTKPEGTGLGLWLSRSLLEVDSGSLAYAREAEQTHFIMALPLAHTQDDPAHPYR
jgi:signal transduction histidine kinase